MRDVPPEDTLIGLRDRAMLAVFLHCALRIGEVARLRVRDYTQNRGFPVLRVHGKRGKIRRVELHPVADQRIKAWLEAAGIEGQVDGSIFRPIQKSSQTVLDKPMKEYVIWDRVRHLSKKAGITMPDFSPHAFRATAITQALEEESELSRVQAWAGHSSAATTKFYDRRHLKPDDSPSFKTNY